MNIILFGAGKLGYFIARKLLKQGYELTVIDQRRDQCERLATALDIRVICADATSVETLALAMAAKCDVFIAVTDKDEDNLIACEIAKKQFKVKRTIAKSNHHSHLGLMRKLGIDIVFDEAQIITEMIDHEIDTSNVQLVADIGNSNAVIKEYDIPLNWSQSGKKVSELKIPEECVLVYLKRQGVFMIPRGNSVIMAGDEIFALTVGSATRQLKKLFEI